MQSESLIPRRSSRTQPKNRLQSGVARPPSQPPLCRMFLGDLSWCGRSAIRITIRITIRSAILLNLIHPPHFSPEAAHLQLRLWKLGALRRAAACSGVLPPSPASIGGNYGLKRFSGPANDIITSELVPAHQPESSTYRWHRLAPPPPHCTAGVGKHPAPSMSVASPEQGWGA